MGRKRKEGRKNGVKKGRKERERGKEGKKAPNDVHSTIFCNSNNWKPLKYLPIMNWKLVTYMMVRDEYITLFIYCD